MIPCILHQIFVSGEQLSSLPNIWLKFSNRSCDIHKDWKYMYWDTKRLKKFIHTYYPEYIDYFTPNVLPVIQSDIARCIILRHFGGWYFDFDYEFFRSLDVWMDESLILPFSRYDDKRDDPTLQDSELCNAVMASDKGHWFWDRMLEGIPTATFFANPENCRAENINDVLKYVGPDKMSEVYQAMSKEEVSKVCFPKRDYFHYPVPQKMSKKEYEDIRSREDVYGLHYTHSSWRDAELSKNLRRRNLYFNKYTRLLIVRWEQYLQKKRKN